MVTMLHTLDGAADERTTKNAKRLVEATWAGRLTFTQDTDSLKVTLPAKPGQGAFALRITGRGFQPMNTPPATAGAAAKDK